MFFVNLEIQYNLLKSPNIYVIIPHYQIEKRLLLYLKVVLKEACCVLKNPPTRRSMNS